MTFFMIFIIFVIIISILTFFTEIRIHIIDLKFKVENKNAELSENFKIIIKFFIFNKINYLKIPINKNKMQLFKSSKNIDKLKKQMIKDRKNIKFKNVQKHLKLQLNRINLKIDIGVENAELTAIIIGLVSTFISIIIGKIASNSNDIQWKVNSIYNNKNLVNFELNCIFSLKLIHIINTIFMMRKEVDKNARTSNRKNLKYIYE